MGSADASRPRIMLIHALRDAMAPIHDAFRTLWPEAETHDLLETSLSADLAAEGGRLMPKMIERFRALGRYAAEAGPDGRGADAILFTCSAFGPAIEAVQREARIPVSKPNEAAFAEAIRIGPRIGLIVTFEPAAAPMLTELRRMAETEAAPVAVEAHVVAGALAALQAGRGEEHDALIAAAAAKLSDIDSILLGQFSMARAARAVRARTSSPVLTTPEAAVESLRARIAARNRA